MKKRIASFSLVLLLLFSVMPAAFAANSSLSNFKPVHTYADGLFADITGSVWFADSVKTAYELGLVQGMNDTQFSPFDSVTVGQTLAFACRLHSIYHTGDGEFVQGDPWYQVYAEYAVKNGIVREGQYTNYNQKATRAQFAAILAKALPEEALAAVNNVKKGNIPDVLESAPYADEVYLLYNAGVLTGNDDYGTFAPQNNIQRSEVATVITRMADASKRAMFALKSDTFAVETDCYRVSVPSSWKGLAEYEVSRAADGGYALTFYEKQSHATLYGGLVFSVRLTADDYTQLPQYDYLGELTVPGGKTFHMIVYYPSDVQFIEDNEEVRHIYQKLCKEIEFILNSIELKSGSTLS